MKAPVIIFRMAADLRGNFSWKHFAFAYLQAAQG